MSADDRTLLIAGGGTGGHVFPALAVAREWLRRGKEAPSKTAVSGERNVLFVGTERGMEARLVPQAGLPIEMIRVAGLKGIGGMKLLRNVAQLPAGLWDSERILGRHRFSAAFGVGGYASGPMMLLAAVHRIPSVVFEPNVEPGFTNRILAGLATRIAVANNETVARLGSKAIVTGCPVRKEFFAIKPKEHREPFRVLITGGSRGALPINQAVIDAMDLLAARKKQLFIVHQTGERDYNAVRVAYARRQFHAEVVPFIENMAERFAQADLIVCRSGAITVAEVSASGRAAIFIPFGASTDAHQTRNAQVMQNAGAARLLPQDELTAERLTNEIFSLLDQPRRIQEMEECARALARPHAVEDIVDVIEGVIRGMNVTFRNFQRIHLIGIGGSGMSGIAEVLLSSGYAVSGSDLKLSATTHRLHKLGATIQETHKAENVHGAHVVVVSSAVAANNVEVVEAHRLKIPVIPRAEMLAELMRLKHGIAVAGAHGKTTTTSLVAAVLAAAGLDPTFVVGGRVNHAGSNARVGQGEYIVVEADESDRSFLLLAPVIAVITTIDREHLDHYASLEEIQETFLQFANRVPFYGSVVLCLDEPNVQAILPRVKRPVITYGTSSQADLVIADVKLKGLSSDFRLLYHGEDLGMFHLPAPPGIHNVRNAAAAAAVALALNVPADLIRAGLTTFAGVGRRFEIKGNFSGVTVVDDYGHHPAEIRATLEAARGCGYKRLLVLFQPHRFTRTQHLWEEFRRSFNQADILIMTDVYSAGEPPIEGITGATLAEAISTAGHKNVVYSKTLQEGIEFMLREARAGDAILTIGAGSVGRVTEELAMLLEARVSTPHAD